MFSFSPDDQLGTAHWAAPGWLAQAREYRPGMFWLGRHPHDYSVAIGAPLNRHAFLCADTRTGKGRAIILNNGAMWPGSYIDVTPKGENATILAPRRAQGDEHCDGMGQETFVLDPFHAADVPEDLRGFFNPFDEFDPDDPLDGATRMINAMKIEPSGAGESSKWLELGADYAAFLATHLYTSELYAPEEKNLVMLRRLTTAGKAEDHEEFRQLHAQGAFDQEFENGTMDHIPDPFELLIREMQSNEAAGGMIKRFGFNLEANEKKHGSYFESVRKNADNITKWLDNPKLAAQVTGDGMAADRRLDLQRIKTDPNGISVFICLPTSRKEFAAGWQRMLIELMLHRFKDTPGAPEAGHKILMSVDEFLGYGPMPSLLSGMTEIAGAGCALFLSAQLLGPIKHMYKEAWETFASSSGLSIWFGLDEKDGAIKHVSELLGEMTIRRIGRSTNMSQSESSQTSTAEGETFGTSESFTETSGKGGSRQTNRSSTTNSGSNTGRNSGATARGGMLIDLLPSSSSGRNSGQHSGRSRTKGTSEGTSWQSSESRQHGSNQSQTTTRTQSHGTTQQRGQSMSEQFFKRPLLTIDEARLHFADFSSEAMHPYHPGLALIVEAGAPPYIVRKSFIDMDPLFVRTFSPHKDYPFIPVKRQPMLEYMYTPEHHFGFRMPLDFQLRGYQLRPAPGLRLGAPVAKGEAFAELVGPPSISFAETKRVRVASIKAPCPLVVSDANDDPSDELSLIIRRQGRTPLPALPCRQVNHSLIKGAKLHRARVKRRQHNAELRRQEQREAYRRQQERYKHRHWYAVKDTATRFLNWSAGKIKERMR